MECRISIGKQDFADMRGNKYFLIDKTAFIKEWWDSGDDVTLITRPRRFGKTLNMSTLNCFFSNKYADRADLFEGLAIWEDEKYRLLQGTYPVIFLSFADVKADNIQDAKLQVKMKIEELYRNNRYLLDDEIFDSDEKLEFRQMNMNMNDAVCSMSLKRLCSYYERCYGKKTIILLDEYDTPMQEAYIHGYWNEFTAFLRSLFNATFKTNPYLERAVMTGITRVSKESMFSDLNNLNVVTTTSEEYSSCFGFTEEEVFAALDRFGLSDKKAEVRKWYDGFTFGSHKDIYNPWSITSYLDKKRFAPYWAATSSNGLVSRLLQRASSEVKETMEELLKGGTIVVNFDEQIVFNQLDADESAIWSLLVAGGYLKVNEVEYRGELLEPWYHLSITNLETMSMFSSMFKGWFNSSLSNYNAFVAALLNGKLKEMNIYMNEVALSTFSSFDTGVHPSERTQPERFVSCCDYQGAANGASLCDSTNLYEMAEAISFYHGFVLGLLVELRDRYEVKSNRESGYGRYDIMLIPKDNNEGNAIVLEFKVLDLENEETLEDTAQSALRQIEDKNYDAELISRGISKERIRHYGFAFEGKKVLIMEQQ